MNKLAEDLVSLFEQRKQAKDTQSIDEALLKRHALIWYDGEVDHTSERYKAFKEKVFEAIKSLSKDSTNLAKDWPNRICDIDECHLESEGVTALHGLDYEDLVRHYLNGGTKFGLAKNIEKQLNSKDFGFRLRKAVENYGNSLLERAKKRHEES